MEYVAEHLANLASELMQEKYIANATAVEYLLPEELLEDAYDIVRLVQTENDIVASLTSQAKKEVLRLVPLLEEEANQSTVESCKSSRELLQNATWVALRNQAVACLQAMQFDLAAWEQGQLSACNRTTPSRGTAQSRALGALRLRLRSPLKSNIGRHSEVATMQLTVHLNRDSVHAGDDLESHAASIDCDSECSIAELIQKVKQTYLPGIAGGEATWIVSCSGSGPSPLGVVAQQWSQPRLRVPLETPISQALGTARPSITFEYWCQKDPQLVFDRIAADREPPSKW